MQVFQMTQTKLNLTATLSCLAFIFCCSQAAMAKNGKAIELIKKAEFEGLSMRSTADEIKSHLAKRPGLVCRHSDVPERKSMIPNRPPQPAQMGWNCTDYNPKHPVVINIKMIAGQVAFIDYQIRYKSPEEHQRAEKQIKELHKSFKMSGLGDKHADKYNYVSYQDSNGEGASAAIYSQKLKAEAVPLCGKTIVPFKLSAVSSAIYSQNAYSVGFKVERTLDHILCEQ